MKYKYVLPESLSSKVNNFEEFANGATQATVALIDGRIIHEVLFSQSKYLVAIRGHKSLPFNIQDIKEIYQSNSDKNPEVRGGWDYFDNWIEK